MVFRRCLCFGDGESDFVVPITQVRRVEQTMTGLQLTLGRSPLARKRGLPRPDPVTLWGFVYSSVETVMETIETACTQREEETRELARTVDTAPRRASVHSLTHSLTLRSVNPSFKGE